MRLSQPSCDCRSFIRYIKLKFLISGGSLAFHSRVSFPSSCPHFSAGGTPLNVLYGDVPLDRVWFFDLSILNRIYNFTPVCPQQGI